MIQHSGKLFLHGVPSLGSSESRNGQKKRPARRLGFSVQRWKAKHYSPLSAARLASPCAFALRAPRDAISSQAFAALSNASRASGSVSVTALAQSSSARLRYFTTASSTADITQTQEEPPSKRSSAPVWQSVRHLHGAIKEVVIGRHAIRLSVLRLSGRN